MSAPEVRIEQGRWRCDCGQFGWIGRGQPQCDIERWAAKHEAECPLIRLQARWDARDEVLRGLITEWRRRVDDRLRLAAASDDPDQYDGFIAGVTVCADELERAIGGGR